MHWILPSPIVGGPRRVNHASVSIGDFIYSFGGYCSIGDYKTLVPMDVHVLNTNNLRWTLLQLKKNDDGAPLNYPDDVPFQRYGHTAIAYNEMVYIWGGRNDEIVCDILFCFDTKTLKWSKPEVTGNQPGARDGHTACIQGDNLYIFGGFEEVIDQFSCDVHCLNLKTMHWSYVQTFGETPSYRDFHSATIINNRMYIFGGRGDIFGPYHSQEEIYCPKMVYLDLKTHYWHHPTTTGQVPLGRRSHSAFVYNSMIYIFGGYNGILDTHFNDLYSFDPVQNKWELTKPSGTPPNARRRQTCLVIGKKMFLFGGTCPRSDDSDDEDESEDLDNRQLFDYDDTHVLDLDVSTLKTLSILCVLKHNLDQLCLPLEIRWDIRMMTTPNIIGRPLNNNG